MREFVKSGVHQLTSALADRYRLEREIGQGGPFTGSNRFPTTRVSAGSAPRQMTIVINWLDELRDRMAK